MYLLAASETPLQLLEENDSDPNAYNPLDIFADEPINQPGLLIEGVQKSYFRPWIPMAIYQLILVIGVLILAIALFSSVIAFLFFIRNFILGRKLKKSFMKSYNVLLKKQQKLDYDKYQKYLEFQANQNAHLNSRNSNMMHARYSNGMTISQVHFQDGTQTKLLLDSSGEPSPVGEHLSKKKDLVKKRNDSIVDVEEKFGNEGNDDDMDI